MERDVTIRFTDKERAALAKTEMTSQELEALMHEMLDEILARRLQLAKQAQRSPFQQKISEILYHAGLTSSMPTGHANFEEVESERKRLADLLDRKSVV